MTSDDLCPGLSSMSGKDQIIEVLTRLRAHLAVLDVSRHLIQVDRDHVDKGRDYADLLRDLILEQYAGAAHHLEDYAKEASSAVPVSPLRRASSREGVAV